MSDPNFDNAMSVLVSVVVGFVLMAPLEMLAEAMHWPLFYGWALAHGSFMLAWPMLTLLTFVVFRAWLRKHDKSRKHDNSK